MFKKLSLVLTCLPYLAFADMSNIDGYWKTIDDVSGQPKAIVQIYTENNITYGKIIDGFPINGVPPREICNDCPAPFTNQKNLGLQILWGFKYDSDDGAYEQGRILDPDSGNIYRSILTPSSDGQVLNVRGYIGLPIIGRTQTWYRLTPDQLEALLKKYPPK